MKARTKASNSYVANLQAGLGTPVGLARIGVAALALTAVSMGFLGAGSASADEPRRLGQPVQTQVVQSTQIKQTQPTSNGSLGKLNTTTVTALKYSSSGTDDNGDSCANRAAFANGLLELSNINAGNGNWQQSFDQAFTAHKIIEEAVANGCVVTRE
jgi:hypothetical protein